MLTSFYFSLSLVDKNTFPCTIISLIQHGAARPDVHSSATSSRLDAVRSVYGVSIARNLMKIEAAENDPSSSFKMDGFISNSNYIAKKITMVLFINGMNHELTFWEVEHHVTIK